MSTTPPATVLVANRGEIALRVMRTLRRMGIGTVAVHTDADAGAPHTLAADTAARVPSYLDAAAVVAAARETGAGMVHPGYGFLSENAAFARAVADAGLVWIGPPAEAIEQMGDKIRAKETVAAAGVPVLGGFTEHPGEPLTDEDLLRRAEETGYPLLLKPSAGGGGKGMRAVHSPDTLLTDAAAARRGPPPSVTTHCSWNAWCSGRATSRCRCSPTPTATSCTWANASAACNGATRRSWRRRPHPC